MNKLTVVLMSMLLASCTTPHTLGKGYYVERDKHVVAILELCSNQPTPVLKEGSTVKDLVVSYVDVKTKLKRCQVVTEEVSESLLRSSN